MSAKYVTIPPSFPAIATVATGILLSVLSPRVCGQTAGYAQSTATTSRVVAALRADNQILQENQRKLVAALEETRQLQAKQAREIANLKQEMATLRATLNQAKDAWQAGLGGVERALRKEGEHRQDSIKEVINTVAKEVSRVASKVQGRPDATAATQGEYVVQRGDTLSAIAKAFDVNVDDLKKVNNLQKDFIREGQKLAIPAK